MLYDLEHPHVPLCDWQKFDREFSPLVGEVIGMKQSCQTGWYPGHTAFSLPATLYFAKRAHRDGMRRPRGWREAVGNDV
jgi:hypothetical protein